MERKALWFAKSKPIQNSTNVLRTARNKVFCMS
ncbi:hypothetical protein CCACVL1_03302 [Corchorus capsularis]|uniref:Uncharacterized protein n=1 Tax=Corchorus capsularis TaxID=210143 RepID=A0A1R3K1A2_COCAP|nr:hypothetical protein CCACVL1_03302 [Corchorus capsularis]